MKKIILMAAVATALGGCASAQDSAKLTQAITAADQELAAAKKAKVGLWVNTADMLKEAKEDAELALSDKAEAMKKVKKVSTEIQLATKQAQDNAKAGPRYPD